MDKNFAVRPVEERRLSARKHSAPEQRAQSIHPLQESTTMTPTLSRALALVAYTVLPLVGVLLLGWDWREIVLLYWLENVTLGAAMVVKLLRSANAPGGDDPAVVGTLTINGRQVQGPGAGLALAGFFTLHYGIFTLVHGIFVIAIISGAFFGLTQPGDDSGVNWYAALIVALVGGAVQVITALVGPLPQQRGSRLMGSAYPRIIVLHLTIILGVFLILAFEWGAAAAILLIALHAAVDIGGWMLSDARARRASAAAQPAGPGE